VAPLSSGLQLSDKQTKFATFKTDGQLLIFFQAQSREAQKTGQNINFGLDQNETLCATDT